MVTRLEDVAECVRGSGAVGSGYLQVGLSPYLFPGRERPSAV